MQTQQILLLTLIFSAGFLFFSQNQGQQLQLQADEELHQLFQKWKQEHQITYNSQSEESYRFNVFVQTYNWIQWANQDAGYEVVGLNHMSGFTNQEYQQRFLGDFQNEQKLHQQNDQQQQQVGDLPSSVDWVQKGAVLPTMEAGSCSSTYAIAPAAALSSLYFINTGNLMQMSAQQIVSCDDNSGGCRGGSQMYTYLYTMQNGIQSEQSYPYTSRNGSKGSCKYDESEVVFTPKNASKIKYGGVDVMKQQLAQQPITAVVDASSEWFQNYKGGDKPFSSYCDTENRNYYVLLTGYNDDAETPYWTLQSSFGTKWGNDGFMYMKIKTGMGICGINSDAEFPGWEKP